MDKKSDATVVLGCFDKPQRQHSLERTSPKGGKFIGRCVQCGETGLGFADMPKECKNPGRVSIGDSVISAIEGR